MNIIGLEDRANRDTLTDDDVAFIVEQFTTAGIVPSNAQAMALVKKLGLSVLQPDSNGWWEVSHLDDDLHSYSAKELNRAIVECVAKMQAGKAAA